MLTPRDHLAAALTALSRTEAVELQAHTHFTAQPVTTDLREGLAEYREARRHYAVHWPPVAHSREAAPRHPAAMLSDALACLRGWIESARTIIQRIEQLTEECAALRLLVDLLERAGEQLPSMRVLG
ncbi:MAG: hypothetical protein EHM84_04145, partial [Lysobacterales bacterium]